MRSRFTAAAAIVIAAVFAGCGQKAATPKPVAPAEASASRPADDAIVLTDTAVRQAGIAVEPVRLVTRSEQAEAPGLVALNETKTARIGSLVDGNVVENLAQIGDRVGSRQMLATIHSRVVHDAWAGYRKAIAERRRMTTELNYAVQAHERAQRLYSDKAIALQELERAAANRASAEEELDQARTEVRRSEEELEHLGITNGEDPTGEQGEFIPVRSPIAGIVLERLVTPGTAVTSGMPLFVVSDLSTLWVLAEIDEARLSRVKTGRPVEVRVAAYPEESFAGTITFVGETVNPRTRRVTVRCQVANTDGRLKPEMFASVVLGESEPRPVAVVPTGAIQTINGRSVVFVAESGGRFRAQPAELGGESGGLVEVRSGVSAGDRIAVSGSFVLKSELLKASAAPES